MVLSISSYFGYRPKPDAEWQRIINKLWNEYGIKSSGNKSLDKQKLHEIELREVQKKNSVKKTFLTLNEEEVKKENSDENFLATDFENSKGAEILGKQIFLAIQIKQEQDVQENKKKRNNKYQT